MTKAKSGIVKVAFKACLKGDVYPRTFSVGEELSGEALEIGSTLKKMGGKTARKVDADKNAGAAPENKTGFTAGAGDNGTTDSDAKDDPAGADGV